MFHQGGRFGILSQYQCRPLRAASRDSSQGKRGSIARDTQHIGRSGGAFTGRRVTGQNKRGKRVEPLGPVGSPFTYTIFFFSVIF